MRVRDARAYVGKHLIPLANRLGLHGWLINWRFKGMEDGDLAEVEVMPEYQRAYITFDARKFEDEAALLRTMRHELLHIVHAPWTAFYKSVLAMLKPNSDADKLIRELRRQAAEYQVVQLEAMYQGLTAHGPEAEGGQPGSP